MSKYVWICYKVTTLLKSFLLITYDFNVFSCVKHFVTQNLKTPPEIKSFIASL